MSLKTWWRRKTGAAKVVTALATLLILQMGLCFASPGEPAWFDRLFHIKPSPHQFRFGLVILEFYICIGTFILLLIAILIRVTSSLGSDGSKLSLIARDKGDIGKQDSGEPHG